jgi:RNA 2',3'-cyclic 3'-phosphodiesterase
MHTNPGTLRLFLAVFPPVAACTAAMTVVEALHTRGNRVAWVRRENLHYTLRFLGDVGVDEALAAAEAAREAAARHAPFNAALDAAGAFPHAGKARVLWLGMREGAEPLCALARSLEDALAARGFARADLPFAPHLTIGRVRMPADWSARLASAPVPEARFRVDSIALVRSTLGPGGSRYEVEAEAPLVGAK